MLSFWISKYIAEFVVLAAFTGLAIALIISGKIIDYFYYKRKERQRRKRQ